ncbi:MAG: hypothetical protein GY937_27080 [bacterium]|nr:hypothetical protein [bacterium]
MTRGLMWPRRARVLLQASLFALIPLALAADSATAISMTAFGPGGAGGTQNGQTLDVGPGGSIFEADAFLHVGGTHTQLSQAGGTVSGLDFAFGSSLSADTTDLTITFTFTNNTAASIGNVSFSSFLDAEIDEPTNTFFNEYATTRGTLAAGQTFEVDEPGFAFGDLFANAQAGTLDGTNTLPIGTPDDVAMGLQFAVGSLAAGQSATISLMISEDGSSLGTFAIDQGDTGASSNTVVTYSGNLQKSAIPPPGPAIPEPTSALVFALGAWLVREALREHNRHRPPSM